MVERNDLSNEGQQVLLERLDTLREDTKEIKQSVNCLDQNYRTFREEYTRGHVQVEASIDSAHTRLDKQEKRIELIVNDYKTLHELIQPMVFAYRILVGISSILGGSILLLVWMMITGQVQLLFP